MKEKFYTCQDIDREKGYTLEDQIYHCLCCDFHTEQGFMYPVDDCFADAEKMMQLHIKSTHGSVFEHLINLDKKQNGFSEHQQKIMQLFYEGKTDYEVQTVLNIGSASTIRNHRHALREKEKQAKTMVTLMALLNKNMIQKETVKPHETATMVDTRYDVTIQESIDTLRKYFPDGTDGPLKTFQMKEKYRIVVLREIVKRFEPKAHYTSKAVDEILKAVYLEDYVLVRRYLIEYGFMDRKRDGRTYWVKENKMNKTKKSQKNEKKKELVQAFMAKQNEAKTESGVYQILNKTNGKIYIGTARSIDQLSGVEFQLNTGSFRNKGLQLDWKNSGSEAFEISVLERFEEDELMNVTKELKTLERQWKAKLLPYGDGGYHKA